MLNYIWIGLILLGIFAAVGIDIRDEIVNPYRNGVELQGTVEIEKKPGPLRTSWEGTLVIPAAAFAGTYGLPDPGADIRQPVTVTVGQDGKSTMSMVPDATAPALWTSMARAASAKDRLMADVRSFTVLEDGLQARLSFVWEPIRFIKLRAVTQAALDYAGTAVTIAIGLIGIMALWLGVMKVAEEAGVLKIVTRAMTPVTRRLFPDIPPDHPAVSAMIMNISANMLGLSNAATPMGLKAMEELNKLNPRAGVATNAMVTFLAINTGGLILIPATAIAVRAAAGSANPGIIIGTSIVGAAAATVAGVTASKILQRLPRYRKAMEVDNG
jgi:spore maturation protein A